MSRGGNPRGVARQYLTFRIDDEEYGVDILRVQEIRGFGDVTPMPDAPGHVLGVINLRGVIVPVVDLRVRLGIAAVEPGPTTVVIVVQVPHEGADVTVGLVVDAVSDVRDVSGEAFRKAPSIGSRGGDRCVEGLAEDGERLVILLDVQRVVAWSVLGLEPGML
ncbi:MAG: purine-binding chemotaxis protein CheW [Ectothiorhodospiraceae bacterium]|nr:purine-binding chemotaxis protein CheW [Chromatiales bacterium]MCP5154763.1 purine-binding chemotaxis protein CheW [Ectothiorhodospiraceae bacterium]